MKTNIENTRDKILNTIQQFNYDSTFPQNQISILLPNFTIDFTDSSIKENNFLFFHTYDYYNQYINTKYFHLKKIVICQK